jgi:hypothetical protein
VVSTLGWLDTDNEQRRKMLEVIDLFKEEGTVDELGIGSIRDALADALFPGCVRSGGDFRGANENRD